MDRPGKLLLLAATVAPVVYLGLFVFVLISTALVPAQSALTEENFIYLLLAHLSVMLLMPALFGCYCVLLYREPNLDVARKIIWVSAMLFTGPFAMLLFWYLQVWKEPSLSSAAEEQETAQ